MGGNFSCFSPADEDYELCKTYFDPNPRVTCGTVGDANFTGRNSNSNPQKEDLPQVKPVNRVSEEHHSCAEGDSPASKASDYSNVRKASEFRQQMPSFRAEQLGYTTNPNNSCARYTMFVRNVNNSFDHVDRILSQRMLLGLQRRYGCRMQQHDDVALFRGNEVRVASIDGPSRSHILKFRSALPTSLTKYLITGVSHSTDVDDVLDTN